jgi:hypothetical protein
MSRFPGAVTPPVVSACVGAARQLPPIRRIREEKLELRLLTAVRLGRRCSSQDDEERNQDALAVARPVTSVIGSFVMVTRPVLSVARMPRWSRGWRGAWPRCYDGSLNSEVWRGQGSTLVNPVHYSDEVRAAGALVRPAANSRRCWPSETW